MLDIAEVRRQMRTQAKTASSWPVDALVDYEGLSFTPPPTDPPVLWVRETLLVAGETLSANDMVETIGQTRYDVFGPRGRKASTIDDAALAIANVFEPAQSIGALGIQLYRTYREPAKTGDVWRFVPVVVEWRVFTFTANIP